MISDIKVWPLKTAHKSIKANVQFVVNNAWKVKGTLMVGEKGMFVGLPGKFAQEFDKTQNKYVDKIDPTTKKKIWYPDVSCIDHEAQRQLNEAVIQAYNKQTGNAPSDQGTAPGPTDQTKPNNIPFG
jgi:DNA-binding cell septation regulator SpoVG